MYVGKLKLLKLLVNIPYCMGLQDKDIANPTYFKIYLLCAKKWIVTCQV